MNGFVPMTRARTVIVVLLYWLVFSTGVLLTICGQLIGIVIYACAGSECVRDWVKRTGKGTDGVCNAAFFGGNPKETISSHVGRWYTDTSGRQIPLRFRFVKWLTDLFEKDHTIKAIEAPFIGLPL